MPERKITVLYRVFHYFHNHVMTDGFDLKTKNNMSFWVGTIAELLWQTYYFRLFANKLQPTTHAFNFSNWNFF